jgi:hypothetical protein
MARFQLSLAKQKKKDRLAAISPKCDQVHLSRSTRADRQAAAGSKGEVRLLFRRACRDLQRVIGDFESKRVLFNLFESRRSVLHGIDQGWLTFLNWGRESTRGPLF